MSLKRQNTSSPEPEDDDRPTKRQQPSWVYELDTFEHQTAWEQPQVDPSSGQQSAFPGLDGEFDELIYGDPEDGLQYLRMVQTVGLRSERRNVPHILVVKQENGIQSKSVAVQDDEDEDYHPDRAWVAAPNVIVDETSTTPPDTQELYYLALLDHFAQLQTHLRISPPLSAIELLSSSQPISFPPDAAKAREKWRCVVRSSDPIPIQLACMDPESVMELVKLLTEGLSGIIRSRVGDSIKRFGRWTWATLARCRDRGELSSEEIAELRELGKRAVQLLGFAQRSRSVRIEDRVDMYDNAVRELDESTPVDAKRGLHPAAALESQEDARYEASPDEVTRLESAKAQIISMLDTSNQEDTVQVAEEASDANEDISHGTYVDKQIHMVLETTITIVGEVYGQRDLLEHRDFWP